MTFAELQIGDTIRFRDAYNPNSFHEDVITSVNYLDLSVRVGSLNKLVKSQEILCKVEKVELTKKLVFDFIPVAKLVQRIEGQVENSMVLDVIHGKWGESQQPSMITVPKTIALHTLNMNKKWRVTIEEIS